MTDEISETVEIKAPGRDFQYRKDESGEVWVKVELREDGVMAMINRVLFHPRGFALSYDDKSREFALTGSGREPWSFQFDPEQAHELHQAFQALIANTAMMNGSAMLMLYDPKNPPADLDEAIEKEGFTNENSTGS